MVTRATYTATCSAPNTTRFAVAFPRVGGGWQAAAAHTATARGTTVAAGKDDSSRVTTAAARVSPQGGKGKQPSRRRQAGTAAAAATPARARRASSSGSQAAAVGVAPPPPIPSGAASVERAFQPLAVAFGETLVPLDRSSTLEEMKRVWVERAGHFTARIQAQQVGGRHATLGRRRS